jgi:hypothetical protein
VCCTATAGADCDVLLAGTAAINIWTNENPTKSLDCRNVRVADSDLSGALLIKADLSGAFFHNCKLIGAKFDYAIVTKTQFTHCDLSKSTFRSTDLRLATIKDSLLDGVSFSNSRGVSQTCGLETCRINDKKLDVNFDLSKCRLVDQFISWNKIRVAGQLRLFLPSYIALAISLLALSSLGFINERLGIFRSVISDLGENGLLSSGVVAKLIVAAQPWHASWRHLAVLASTLAIAFGATLYLFCPSRIKEFTLDQWMFLAERPSFEYHVSAWASPPIRVACAFWYGVGGAIAAVLLFDTLIRAAVLIVHGMIS